MQSAVSGKSYFLRQSGRITGPYSMLKLNAMYHRGTLKCEDMCSEDKIRWHYINVLFPALTPSSPIAISETPAAPQDRIIKVLTEQESSPSFADDTISANGPQLSIPLPAKEMPEPLGQPPLAEWLADIGRTMALVWDFREMLQKHGRKGGRFLGIAPGIHVFLALMFVLIFGKYYSLRFHWFFSPLMGLSLLTILWGTACLIGWFAARRSVTAGKERPAADWKICAAGFFVNYGILACCVMALAHGKEHLWVRALLVFIDSCILCSCVILLRDFLEENGKNWKAPVICTVLILNPVLAAVIYGFVTLI